MLYFCTYFDRNYLTRGLALFRSLQRNCNEFKLYILCLDEDTYSIISKLANQYGELVPIALSEIEQWDQTLLIARGNRSRIEYYFTISPVLPLYVVNQFSKIDIITYLDADLYFYSNPKIIYQELPGKSILITGHNFPKSLRYLEVYGKYNVQYQSFRNDAQGISCLNRWRKQCLNWCYDRLENGKFADQKYLDEWPTLYDKLVVSELKGVGVAPWNIAQYEINYQNGDFYVDDQILVFFHFHALKKVFPSIYSTNYSYYRLTSRHINLINLYKGYLQELKKVKVMFDIPVDVGNREIRNSQFSFIDLLKQGLKGNLIFDF